MTTRRFLVVIGLLAGMLGSWLVPASAAPAPAFTTLDPGKPARLTEEVPLQVVMLGYEPDLVAPAHYSEYLTNQARPIDRQRTYQNIIRNGLGDRYWDDPLVREQIVEMGLHYSFDHKLVYADTAYEDAFFAYLSSIGVEEDVLTRNDTSLYQRLYNAQATNKLDITNNLVIDPAKVERWLLDHPAPGIDPSKNTVVLVNWWGRDDFRFHDYEVEGEAQSENGLNMAKTYWFSRLISWGGTGEHDEESSHGKPSRTWFHDLSAGPDWRTGGWVLDTNIGQLGPDPSWQITFPPVWEYLLGGAQDRVPLTDALGLLTRFVAVNLFFAASPLYGTDTDAHISDDIELDVTVHGNVAVTPSLLREELGDLLGRDPRIEIDRKPNSGSAAKCHQAFVANVRCRPETDPAVYPVDANFFLGSEREIPQWRDGSAGYEAPGSVFEAQQTRKWVGAALDNWSDGSRTAAYTFLAPSTFAFGLGTTSTLVHEYGHHFGVSHPHDGFESEWPTGAYAANYTGGYNFFYFTWAGDEVSSTMSYMNLENDFSQFDVDNYQRWQAARYLRAANMIAGQVVGSSKLSAGAASLAKADAAFTAAQRALTAHDYKLAMTKAAEGYQHARGSAAAAKVTIPTVDRWAMTQPGSWHGKGERETFAPATDPVDAMTAGAVPADLLERFGAGARR